MVIAENDKLEKAQNYSISPQTPTYWVSMNLAPHSEQSNIIFTHPPVVFKKDYLFFF